MDTLVIFLTTFFAILKILAVCFGGYVLARIGLLHKQLTKDMGKVIFTIMIPCMIFGNIINNVDIRKLGMVGILFLFPIITHLTAFTLGQLLRLILRYKNEDEEYLLVVAGSTFGNHGNISVPLVAAILGDPRGPFADDPVAIENGSAYVMVYMSMTSCILWGVGMPWFRRRNAAKLQREQDVALPQHGTSEESHKPLLKADSDDESDNLHYRGPTPKMEVLKAWVSTKTARLRKTYIYELLTLPPVFALTTSLIIALIPPVREAMVHSHAKIIPDIAIFVGDASIPIILMTLGANLAENTKEAHVPKRITFSVLFTRLIVLPACGISLVYALLKFGLLPNDTILLFLIMIQFSMPSAINLVLACQVAGGGEAKMSSLLFWQYCFCSFSISCVCIIVQLILL